MGELKICLNQDETPIMVTTTAIKPLSL